MTLLGIDYAFGRPSVAVLDAMGVEFVCRYVSTPGNEKNATADEIAALVAAGKKIVLIFETTADRALDGFAAGVADAKAAQAQAAAVGKPPEAPLYFAVDFNAQPSQFPAVFDYFRGVISVLGLGSTGAYGGILIIKALFDAGLISYAWQTYAWSSGQWEPRAHIQQYDNNHTTSDGVGFDWNRAVQPIYGAWQPNQPYVPNGGDELTPEQEKQLALAAEAGRILTQGPTKKEWGYNLWTLLVYGVTGKGTPGILQTIKAAQDPKTFAAAMAPLLPDVTTEQVEAAFVAALQDMANPVSKAAVKRAVKKASKR